MNSVLQALYFCSPFREEVLKYYSTLTEEEFQEGRTMLMALAEAFYSVQSNKKQNGIFRPHVIVKRLQKQNGKLKGIIEIGNGFC